MVQKLPTLNIKLMELNHSANWCLRSVAFDRYGLFQLMKWVEKKTKMCSWRTCTNNIIYIRNSFSFPPDPLYIFQYISMSMFGTLLCSVYVDCNMLACDISTMIHTNAIDTFCSSYVIIFFSSPKNVST